MQTPAMPPPPPSVAATAYAGFWRRVGAALIDGLIVGAATAPITLLAINVDVTDAGATTEWMRSPLYPVVTVAQWLYFALMESSSRQATVGKMALGIRVTDVDGRRVSFGRATGRYFAKFLSALILGIGFLMAAFTEKKQALHDMIAGTLVVR
ncbi:MAG TPA: RDD family protein [Actinomycetota bacterium]|nr:RDD family protein [Actinomycetota bacterium]